MSDKDGISQHPITTLPVRTVPPSHIFRWIKLGWKDFIAAGYPSFLHGLIVFIASIAITMLAFLYWPVLPGAISAFILVGPILATGLYALSHRLEKNEKPKLRDVYCAWKTSSRCLFAFGIMLIAAALAWMAITVLLFGFFVDIHISEPVAFIRYVFLQNDLHFLLWAIFGGLGAATLYGLAVVSVPLLLDRDLKSGQALRTSISAVGENPVTMGLWALFILVATGISILTMMLGFIILYPVMGHASWHVYRDLVDVEGVPVRERAK